MKIIPVIIIYSSTSATPPQSLVALHLITRTRKQLNEPQKQAVKLQTILNYRLQTDSFPPQDSAAIHYTHKKRKKETQKELKAFLPTVLPLSPQDILTGTSTGDHKALILSPQLQYMTLLPTAVPLLLAKVSCPPLGQQKQKYSRHPQQPQTPS